MNNILMVEDDQSLISGLSFAIEKAGYEIDIARNGVEMQMLWGKGTYDLVILDVSLPDTTGFELCEKIRESSKVPILFLTAADDEMDIVRGLDIGGDDYITKPFKLAILISRINALLRRSQDFTEEDIIVRSDEISIDKLKCEVQKNGKRIELTTSEYKLLLYFVENSGVVLSSNQILGHLWDYDERYVDVNTLTVYIRRLRTKIEDNPSSPKFITTVRGRGYKWNGENKA